MYICGRKWIYEFTLFRWVRDMLMSMFVFLKARLIPYFQRGGGSDALSRYSVSHFVVILFILSILFIFYYYYCFYSIFILWCICILFILVIVVGTSIVCLYVWTQLCKTRVFCRRTAVWQCQPRLCSSFLDLQKNVLC